MLIQKTREGKVYGKNNPDMGAVQSEQSPGKLHVPHSTGESEVKVKVLVMSDSS